MSSFGISQSMQFQVCRFPYQACIERRNFYHGLRRFHRGILMPSCCSVFFFDVHSSLHNGSLPWETSEILNFSHLVNWRLPSEGTRDDWTSLAIPSGNIGLSLGSLISRFSREASPGSNPYKVITQTFQDDYTHSTGKHNLHVCAMVEYGDYPTVL